MRTSQIRAIEATKNASSVDAWLRDSIRPWGYKITQFPDHLFSDVGAADKETILAQPAVIAAKTEAERIGKDTYDAYQAHETAKAKKKTREEAEEKARLARRTAQLVGWVQANGTESQVKRLSRNALPEDEILNEIRDQVFAPLGEAGLERYKALRAADVVAACGDEGREVKFGAETVTEHGSGIFAQVEMIEALLPEARVAVKLHRGYYVGNEGPHCAAPCSCATELRNIHLPPWRKRLRIPEVSCPSCRGAYPSNDS